jgi:hypothetical protein
MKDCDCVARARHHVRRNFCVTASYSGAAVCPTDCPAVQITMLFWGFKKNWLNAFNREQNVATVDDLGSM